MINVVVPIVEDVGKFCEFIDSRSDNHLKFFVGVRESLLPQLVLKSKNVEIRVFKDGCNKEEIINALATCKLTKGKILIVRRVLSDEEFLHLTTSQSDIATLKARHGKLMSAFKSFAKKLVNRFFAFSFFEDISAICYGESMFDLMSVCPNISMATRVNRYVGVTTAQFETNSKPVAREFNKHLNNLKFAMWILFFLGSVAGGVLLCLFTPLVALTVIGVFFWILIALLLLFVGIVNFTRTVSVGNLRFGIAEEVPELRVVPVEEEPKKEQAQKAKKKTATKAASTKTKVSKDVAAFKTTAGNKRTDAKVTPKAARQPNKDTNKKEASNKTLAKVSAQPSGKTTAKQKTAKQPMAKSAAEKPTSKKA